MSVALVLIVQVHSCPDYYIVTIFKNFLLHLAPNETILSVHEKCLEVANGLHCFLSGKSTHCK